MLQLFLLPCSIGLYVATLSFTLFHWFICCYSFFYPCSIGCLYVATFSFTLFHWFICCYSFFYPVPLVYMLLLFLLPCSIGLYVATAFFYPVPLVYMLTTHCLSPCSIGLYVATLSFTLFHWFICCYSFF